GHDGGRQGLLAEGRAAHALGGWPHRGVPGGAPRLGGGGEGGGAGAGLAPRAAAGGRGAGRRGAGRRRLLGGRVRRPVRRAVHGWSPLSWSLPSRWSSRWSSSGSSTAMPSFTPPREPGRLTTKLRPAMPARPRLRRAVG